MNYEARELNNEALKVDFYKGEILEEEYMGRTWPEDRLAPHGDRRVRPQVKKPLI